MFGVISSIQQTFSEMSEINTNSSTAKPQSSLLLRDKYVKVQLIKNTAFHGFVNSIDPITSSIIISTPSGDSYKTTLIPGHAIVDIIQIEPDKNNVKPPTRKGSIMANETDIKERKTKLIAWLKLNLLPVSECEDKIIFGNASLLPPYTAADICTNNPMVVMEMRKIIERMPSDFEPSEATVRCVQ